MSKLHILSFFFFLHHSEAAEAGVVRAFVAGAPVTAAVFRCRDFLFLSPAAESSWFAGQATKRVKERILLDPLHAGRVYVRGIFVEERRGLVHGVDLNLTLHRDRASVASRHDLRSSIGYIWADAIVHPTRSAELLPKFVRMLQDTPRSLEAEIPSRFWIPMLEQFP
jgi:hypothetical protein